jgi:hypothetical protein
VDKVVDLYAEAEALVAAEAAAERLRRERSTQLSQAEADEVQLAAHFFLRLRDLAAKHGAAADPLSICFLQSVSFPRGPLLRK